MTGAPDSQFLYTVIRNPEIELELRPGRRGKTGRPNFQAILEQSIREGLLHVLGPSGLQMVASLCPLERIPADPARFHEVLKSIFKEGGALIIEREIASRLLEGLGEGPDASSRPSHSWLASASSRAKAPRGASKKEREVLRQFLVLESLPRTHPLQRREETQISVTAARFAFAFKKKGN